jgi:alpha-1,2-mannosyltransferase
MPINLYVITLTCDSTDFTDPLSVWIPSSFRRPSASPYPSWSVTTTKPLPYRPFRYGPKYNITMGLRSMHWDDWIELDNEFLKYHSIKASRIAKRGAKCCKTAPEARDAAIELLEELCAYLPERYPSLFQGLGRGRRGVRNLATGETIDIKERLEVDMQDPMQVCALLVQDDLAIMIEVRRRSNKTVESRS